jgi:hypothetical protein
MKKEGEKFVLIFTQLLFATVNKKTQKKDMSEAIYRTDISDTKLQKKHAKYATIQ